MFNAHYRRNKAVTAAIGAILAVIAWNVIKISSPEITDVKTITGVIADVKPAAKNTNLNIYPVEVRLPDKTMVKLAATGQASYLKGDPVQVRVESYDDGTKRYSLMTGTDAL